MLENVWIYYCVHSISYSSTFKYKCALASLNNTEKYWVIKEAFYELKPAAQGCLDTSSKITFLCAVLIYVYISVEMSFFLKALSYLIIYIYALISVICAILFNSG